MMKCGDSYSVCLRKMMTQFCMKYTRILWKTFLITFYNLIRGHMDSLWRNGDLWYSDIFRMTWTPSCTFTMILGRYHLPFNIACCFMEN